MAILAYDDAMLREPRLLVRNGRPIGPVKPALPAPIWAATFCGTTHPSRGLPSTLTPGGASPPVPSEATGLQVLDYNDSKADIGTFGTLQDNNYTILMRVYAGELNVYTYLFAAPGIMAFALAHGSVSNQPGIYNGSAITGFSTAYLASNGNYYNVALTSVASGSVACAINGTYIGTNASCSTAGATTLALNSYTASGISGFNNGRYEQLCFLKRRISVGELIDLSIDSSLWWVPA